MRRRVESETPPPKCCVTAYEGLEMHLANFVFACDTIYIYIYIYARACLSACCLPVCICEEPFTCLPACPSACLSVAMHFGRGHRAAKGVCPPVAESCLRCRSFPLRVRLGVRKIFCARLEGLPRRRICFCTTVVKRLQPWPRASLLICLARSSICSGRIWC
jgi:hypothetical protein